MKTTPEPGPSAPSTRPRPPLTTTERTHDLTITSTGLVNEFLFSARAVQNDQMGAIGETMTVASGPATTAVALQAIRPGAFRLP